MLIDRWEDCPLLSLSHRYHPSQCPKGKCLSRFKTTERLDGQISLHAETLSENEPPERILLFLLPDNETTV